MGSPYPPGQASTAVLSMRASRGAVAASSWGLALLAVFAVLWVLQYGLRVAPLGPIGGVSLFQPLGAFQGDPPVQAASDWITRRAPLLRKAFQEEVYGELPAASSVVRTASRLVDANAFEGAGRIEEISLSVAGPKGPIPIDVLLALPRVTAGGAAPLIIAPNFCGNRAALGDVYRDVSQPGWVAPRCRTAFGRVITESLHGKNIIRVPVARLLHAGYAVMTFSPGEVVPDDPSLAAAAIERLPPSDAEGPRVGAIGAWAWSISRIVDAAESDPRLDSSRIAVFGHSRFGKTVLLAAAFDTRIHAVIANQSGRLGAAPSSDRSGEPLAALFERFPHWFPMAAWRTEIAHTPPDQQLLLALIAPRPLLLGGASLDALADPVGAFQSARSASAAYRLFGGTGLEQGTMRATNLDADVAYYFRSGGHGVRSSDWAVAIAFLDRRFASNKASSTGSAK